MKRLALGAALLCFACPEKRWFVEAQVPAEGKDTAKERIVTVTASREVELDIGHDGDWHNATPMSAPTWPGTAMYIVPKGIQLGRVQITKACSGGCSECIPPRDGSEYIRIDHVATR